MFQPKYTMIGYDLKEEPTANSQGFARVLRTLLTSKLPLLHSAIRSRVSEAITEELSNYEDVTSMATLKPTGIVRAEHDLNMTGWSSVRTFPFAKTVVTKANSCVFFGDDIGDCFTAIERLRLTQDSERFRALGCCAKIPPRRVRHRRNTSFYSLSSCPVRCQLRSHESNSDS